MSIKNCLAKLCCCTNKEKQFAEMFQRSSVDTFLMSVRTPLGNLNFLKVWHDNSGKHEKASWFLKFIIVHDLQTREKFYFICNTWLSFDKGDGQIQRILPVAGSMQKVELKYLAEKQTKEKLRDGHLWFSIFARPALSSFTRTDRLTCCFVLLYITMLINIMYYEQDKSSSSGQLTLGPLSLSKTQVILFYF